MLIPVVCHTNLDLLPCERWPKALPAVPRVGDTIESGYHWKREQYALRLSLKVVAVRWCWSKSAGRDEFEPADVYVPRVELHVPPPWTTLTEFYEWYGRVTGKGKSFFI